ncbi:hypothetical protein RM780_00495 [Streptomyces sp. DSM 44917]|uniref:Integral membrane protein n=1 Tax=Streptomyces boetiae TaxID=3075541 RepID=A0ABU2L1L6_9ACTN|nr:hypothetical protein [Streptomyces sp. DSM 44917]MDT0305444.1 hypothetical protein [Streptomyces sp. DSM 44917]
MGIEGEQLVYDYLSRVGDLAHGTSLSAAERAGLVNRLRDQIGRERAAAGGAESPAAVKRILGRMGRPEDVVAAAADGPAAPAPAPARPAPPAPRRAGRGARPGARQVNDSGGAGRRIVAFGKGGADGPSVPVPPPRTPADAAGPAAGPAGPTAGADVGGNAGASAPGNAGGAGFGPGGAGPGAGGRRPVPDEDAWPDGPIGRFVGGIEIPELLRPPTERELEEAEAAEAAGEEAAPAGPATDVDEAADGAGAAPGRGARGRAARGRGAGAGARKPSRGRRVAKAALTGRRIGGPVELLGVLVLLAGVVVGQIVILALGWVIAWWSPRLSRREAKWASFGMPGVVVGGWLLWLMARAGGYWGEPLADGQAEDLFADHLPWLVRGAALASAAFLLYRARRHRPPAEG